MCVCVCVYVTLHSLTWFTLCVQDEGNEQEEQRLRTVQEDGPRPTETHRRRHQAATQPHRIAAPHLKTSHAIGRRVNRPILNHLTLQLEDHHLCTLTDSAQT